MPRARSTAASTRWSASESREDFVEPARDRAAAWQEARAARQSAAIVTDVRQAPDLTPVFSAAAPLGDGSTLLVTDNDRDFTRTVRKQRRSLGARARPGRDPVDLPVAVPRADHRPPAAPASRIAAHRVRLGRAREVRVPRLPSRRDEIGMLARAVSDMSQSLRHRIDNIEAFAADVTHELKNPLASLRSAVDSLDRVDDPTLRSATGRRHPPGRDPARPADRRHRRGRADRRRAGPRARSSRSTSAR